MRDNKLRKEKNIMNVNLLQHEKDLLDSLYIQYKEDLTNDDANNLVSKLSDTLQALNTSQRNIAEDIITKITMHPDW